MPSSFSSKTLKEPTLKNKFNVVILLILLILVFTLASFWSSMKVMSSIRSYVTGEGLWSKNEKEAVINLIKYTNSNNEDDYARFQKDISVPLGDKKARLELNKNSPDYSVVRQGFIQGGNNPSDVNDLIFLYRHFKGYTYMAQAITIWSQGDQGIAKLVVTANQIHMAINVPGQTPAAKTSQLAPLTESVYTTDSSLTNLENNFSATLGKGSRNVLTTLIIVTSLTTIILGILTISVAILKARSIIKLDKAKSEFISTASHQLRTPVTAINWYAETLLTQKGVNYSPQQLGLLKKLHEATKRTSHLISDLLSVSMLDLGTYKEEKTLVNLKSIISSVLDDLKLITDQKNLKIKVSIAKDAQQIYCDEKILSAIIQNLISNSVKYSYTKGKINIIAKTAKSNLLLSISDQGIGIPANQQSKVFSKLFKADNTKKISNHHTGLGLYVTKGMVRKVGGQITFKSIENKGTTFYVKLPLDGNHGG